MTSIIEINNGDCLELMKDIPDKSVDLFICDLPYAETNCKWDVAIDMDKFWSEFRRLRASKRTACIHFCSTKFGYTLIKSWEKGFKMDMVWKKRNKTGGLQSRHRPMRNHEMVYFFYEQAPKYNRDTYHKRIQPKKEHNIEKEDLTMGTTHKMKDTMHKCFDPPNPASVLEEADVYGETKTERKKRREKGDSSFNPPNPASVIEEKFHKDYEANGKKGMTKTDMYSTKCIKEYRDKNGVGFEPKLPASVVEEKCLYGFNKKDKQNYAVKDLGKNHHFNPPNPASVLEENASPIALRDEKPKKKLRDKTNSTRAKEGKDIFGNNDTSVKPFNYDPPNPASVLEEKDERINKDGKSSVGWDIKYMDKPRVAHFEPKLPASVVEADDEPVSMFESTKVFIGKRHHQTEKPQDILEFFLKYWTDEGDTVLDPTMGSGSTGVACKKLGRNFIGYEMDEKIFKVAEARIEKGK